MVINQSNYVLERKGLLSYDSLSFVMNLYLPIIGHEATFLYLFLMNEIKQDCNKGILDDLVIKSNLSRQDFLLAKQKIESIGLMTTYQKNTDESYVFLLNDPETPKNFFANLVLKGLFINSTSEEQYKKIIKKYQLKISLNGYKDITSSLEDSFDMRFDYEVVDNGENLELEGRNKNILKDNFSDVKLINYLSKHTQFSVSSFSDEEIKNVHRIATLYGLNESVIGELTTKVIEPMNRIGNKINIDELRINAQAYVKNFNVTKPRTNKKTPNISSTSDVGKLITYYESTSPRMFIKNKQKGIEIADADKKILDMLAFEMQFTDGMINALLDYVMKVTEGDLNKNYISKIATSLIRKGATDTLGVLELLNKEVKVKLSTKPIKTSLNKKTVEEDPNNYLDLSSLVVDDDEDIDNI